MYRSDDFFAPGIVMPDVAVGRFHRLAEAIRRGCELRPKKVKRQLRRGECAADALGAAAAGCGVSGRYTRRGIVKMFPELGGYVQHPLSGHMARLEKVIVSLNDYADYTREEIANWLCRLGGCEHPVSGRNPIPVLDFRAEFRSAGDGRYHCVAEAIRRGCELRPKKVRQYYWSGDDGACALGAALCGAAGQEYPKDSFEAAIDRTFPELRNVAADPLTGTQASVGEIVNRLNEETRNSRQAIANWLCVEGGCKHPLDKQLITDKPCRSRSLCRCAVCRDLGFVPDLAA